MLEQFWAGKEQAQVLSPLTLFVLLSHPGYILFSIYLFNYCPHISKHFLKSVLVCVWGGVIWEEFSPWKRN